MTFISLIMKPRNALYMKVSYVSSFSLGLANVKSKISSDVKNRTSLSSESADPFVPRLYVFLRLKMMVATISEMNTPVMIPTTTAIIPDKLNFELRFFSKSCLFTSKSGISFSEVYLSVTIVVDVVDRTIGVSVLFVGFSVFRLVVVEIGIIVVLVDDLNVTGSISSFGFIEKPVLTVAISITVLFSAGGTETATPS